MDASAALHRPLRLSGKPTVLSCRKLTKPYYAGQAAVSLLLQLGIWLRWIARLQGAKNVEIRFQSRTSRCQRDGIAACHRPRVASAGEAARHSRAADEAGKEPAGRHPRQSGLYRLFVTVGLQFEGSGRLGATGST